MTTNVVKPLSIFGLIMLITGAIDSIRNMPAIALFGPQLIFFFIFAALVFLVPVALVSAELSSTFTKRSGIYAWTEYAFGPKTGFFAIWLQWINTVVWYPTILSFIAGTFAYLINPELAQNRLFLVVTILSVFWIMTLINLRGIKTSGHFASFCAVIGLFIPVLLIILLALIWIFHKGDLQLHFTSKNFFPTFSHSESWISLTAIVTSFLGIELACVHVNKVNNPKKTFPKALSLSTLLILLTMISGSLAIAIVIPHAKIDLVTGVMQTFELFFKTYHLTWMTFLLAVMILIGSMGGMINWIISPAKGLQQAASEGFLPPFFAKKNKHDVSSHILLIQGILVTCLCLVFLLVPSVNGSYWLLTDLSTEMYVIMYMMMFVSMLVIHFKYENRRKHYHIPGGIFGLWAICIAGLFGCSVAFAVGFFPPEGIDVGGTFNYEMMFVGGLIAMLLPLSFFYWYHRKYGCKNTTANRSQ